MEKLGKKRFKILSVCGSGTVSSTMVGDRLKDIMDEKGYILDINEVKPTEVSSYVDQGGVDFIIATTTVSGDYDIPVLNAVPFLTGFGEEEFLEELMETIEELENQ